MKQIGGQRDLLIFFAELFYRYKIHYLLTGSFAVSYYGFPRATHDIDFVLELSNVSKKKLLQALGFIDIKQFMLDINAFQQNPTPDLLTLFHFETGTKIDLWIKNAKEFNENWQRRQEIKIEKQVVFLVSPEDLILTKLSWCKELPSERHLRDCIGIWKVQKEKLDLAYLRIRAKELGIISLLGEISEADY